MWTSVSFKSVYSYCLLQICVVFSIIPSLSMSYLEWERLRLLLSLRLRLLRDLRLLDRDLRKHTVPIRNNHTACVCDRHEASSVASPASRLYLHLYAPFSNNFSKHMKRCLNPYAFLKAVLWCAAQPPHALLLYLETHQYASVGRV